MSEELTPASCPNEGVAILQICHLWKEDGASEWQADFGHTTICIVPPGECEHCVTLCAECLDDWNADHIVRLALADTPRPEIPEP
jgi:hypothetical protein